MSKEEFLAELRGQLKGLPKADLEDRMAFYAEMIDDRIDEGKTEEEAIAEVGPVEKIVNEIAAETKLGKLLKEKIRPRRKIRAWEIVLIVLGFPLWVPLLAVAFVLALVAYLLIWVLVIVTYTIEIALMVSSVGGIVYFFANLFAGTFNPIYIGYSLLAAGAAVLLFFGCIGATKLTLRLSKRIFTGIKARFIRKGRKEA